MKQLSPAQKGLVTGALMIIANVLSLYVLKNPVESNFQFVVYALFSGGIAWSLISYSKSGAGQKSFKNYFNIGFKTFIVVTLLMVAFTYIYFTYNTGFRDQKIIENNRLLIEQGNHLPNEIEANASQLKKMFMPLMISSAVFRYLILGALVTVITAGFLNRKALDFGKR
jgi:hypothetical protein